MFRLGLIIATLLLVFVSPPVRAAVTWTYGSSEHFEVYTTGGESRARDVLAYFERIHAFFADFLKLSPQQHHPTRIIVFSNAREFDPYKPNAVAGAYYQGGPDRDYIVMQSFDQESYPVVAHEYVHLIIRYSGDTYPSWLNEGLAEFFSTVEPSGGKMTVGRVPMERIHGLTDGTALFPLARLFAVGPGSPEYNTQQHAGMFYAESWALTHMVMTADSYRARSQQFLDAAASEKTSEAAFQAVYGQSIKAVTDDLQIYIRSGLFKYFVTSYREPRPASSFAIRPVESFEGRLMTATLLAEGARSEQAARAALATLATERPDDLSVLETQAYFEMRRGNDDTARALMARAVTLGSKNARLYRDYAQAGGGPGSSEAPLALLQKASDLDPEDAGIRLQYAEALSNVARGQDALDALSLIRRVPAGDAFAFYHTQANALAQTQHFDEARTAAANAVTSASPGNQEEYARGIVKQLDDFMARQAEVARAVANPTATDAPTSTSGSPGVAASAARKGPSEDFRSVAEGQIANLHCDGQPVIMDVVVGSGLLRLLLDSPSTIKIEGGAGPTVDLTCGAQHTKVKVTYLPDVDPAHKTHGIIRKLDFR